MKSLSSVPSWVMPAAGLCALLLVGVTLAALVRRQTPARSGGDVPLFKTPAWATHDEEEIKRELERRPGETYQPAPRPAGTLMLRRESAEGGALLLRHTARDSIYRYDPAARSLTPAPADVWQRASGRVADCGGQLPPASGALMVEQKSDRLLAGGREIATAGRVPLKVLASPSGRWAAVLSAAGPRVGSDGPVFGSAVKGQRYHQLLSLPDAAPAGEASKLPVLREETPLDLCWSADEQFVVYADMGFFSLAIVETGLPPSSKP
jgi:hypothetical protein